MTAPVAKDFPGTIPSEWWRRYCAPDTGDPATRARLKRCDSFAETLGVSAAMLLARRLGALRDVEDRRLETALGLARVLAHITTDDVRTPMRAAGWPSFPGDRTEGDVEGSQRPKLSELRFRRLLQTGGGEEQVTAFVRLIRLLGGQVNVAALARDYLNWDRDTTKHRWAFDYYAASTAAPATVLSTMETEA